MYVVPYFVISGVWIRVTLVGSVTDPFTHSVVLCHTALLKRINIVQTNLQEIFFSVQNMQCGCLNVTRPISNIQRT